MNQLKVSIDRLLETADIDDIFHYKIYRHRRIDDFCRTRIFRDMPDICVLTDPKNSGMSVTNSIEFIQSKVAPNRNRHALLR